jgi:cytochrome c-type biogenesis protein CcmF
VVGVVLILARHWGALPADKPGEAVWTREFFLYLAAITFIFASIVLSFWTSLPVFNSLFGTNLAIKGSVPFHYYKWMVWFGVAIAVLSGIGQYYFWTRIESKSLSRAVFRPFAFALVASMFGMGLLVYFKKTLIHNEALVEALKATKAEGTLAWLAGCVKYGLLLGADELLLTAALFTLAANVDIIRRLVSRGWVNLRHTGGSLAHIGFGLMLLGILFSAGYEETVSVNPNPQALGNSITEEKKRDNLLLRYNQSTQAKGYTVTYKGKVQATPPITNLTVLEADVRWGKVSFEDTKGHRYAMFFPVEHFRIPGDTLFKPTRAGRPDPASFNLTKLKYFIETQLHISEPEMVNQRSIYQLEFVSTTNPNRKFMLYPEAESSGETGLISHPDREMTLAADLYTHVFGIPSEEKESKQTWREVIPYVKVSPNDTFSVKGNLVTLEAVEQRKDIPGLDSKDLAIQARLKITTPAFQTYRTAPIYMLDHTNRSLLIESYVPEIGLRFAFTGALPQENKLIFQVIEKQPTEDYVIFNAIHKPGINLLWLGTFIMTAGFGTALARRLRERT